MIHPTRILLTAAFSLLSVLSVHTANAQKYNVIFLGTFGGDQTVATAINDLDEVVGYSQLSVNTGAQNAFLYRNAKLIDLDPNPKDFASWATGINHYGQIVGFYDRPRTALKR
jgi:probable HAF family extracellular repeat protein